MTKPKENSDTNWKVVASKKQTFTTFYLILLILLTISSVFGLFQLGAIDDTIASLNTQPVLSSITLVQYVITLVMTVGLIYLYKKEKRGLWLVLTGYGVGVICSIVFLFFKDPLVEDITSQVVAGGSREVTPELARSVANTVLTIAPILNAVASVLFGTLWYFAWQKQVAADSKKKPE